MYTYSEYICTRFLGTAVVFRTWVSQQVSLIYTRTPLRPAPSVQRIHFYNSNSGNTMLALSYVSFVSANKHSMSLRVLTLDRAVYN